MRIVLGELDGRDTSRRQRTVEALRRMGIAVEPTDTIRKAMWTNRRLPSSTELRRR